MALGPLGWMCGFDSLSKEVMPYATFDTPTMWSSVYTQGALCITPRESQCSLFTKDANHYALHVKIENGPDRTKLSSNGAFGTAAVGQVRRSENLGFKI